jgi:hypothetical protein
VRISPTTLQFPQSALRGVAVSFAFASASARAFASFFLALFGLLLAFAEMRPRE